MGQRDAFICCTKAASSSKNSYYANREERQSAPKQDSGHMGTPTPDQGEAASRRSLDKLSAPSPKLLHLKVLQRTFPPSAVHTPYQHSANLWLDVEANNPPDTSLCGAVRAVQLTRTRKALSHPKHICLLGSFGNAAKRCVDTSRPAACLIYLQGFSEVGVLSRCLVQVYACIHIETRRSVDLYQSPVSVLGLESMETASLKDPLHLRRLFRCCHVAVQRRQRAPQPSLTVVAAMDHEESLIPLFGNATNASDAIRVAATIVVSINVQLCM